MPANTAPEAVVFDLGNVLIAHDPFPAVAAGVGEEEARAFLAATDFSWAEWNRHQDAGRAIADALAEVERTHSHWHRHAVAYQEHFPRSLVGAIEPNVAVLRDLDRAGVPLYALSNWSAENFHEAEARFDFLGLFDDLVISGRERLAKPDPALYAVLAERVGRPLERCVYVDDAPRNVDAARTAGMDAILFGDGVDLRAELRRRSLPV